jgi:hypothetical protein
MGKHSITTLKKLTIEILDNINKELGTQRDSVLARKYNISREYIRQLRNKQNIPKYSKKPSV